MNVPLLRRVQLRIADQSSDFVMWDWTRCIAAQIVREAGYPESTFELRYGLSLANEIHSLAVQSADLNYDTSQHLFHGHWGRFAAIQAIDTAISQWGAEEEKRREEARKVAEWEASGACSSALEGSALEPYMVCSSALEPCAQRAAARAEEPGEPEGKPEQPQPQPEPEKEPDESELACV